MDNIKNLFFIGTLHVLLIFPLNALSQQQIELEQYIEQLRLQFEKLAETRDGKPIPIYISPIDIELSAVVTNEGTAGVKFYVVELGADLSNQETQTLKFTISFGAKDEWFNADNKSFNHDFYNGPYGQFAIPQESNPAANNYSGYIAPYGGGYAPGGASPAPSAHGYIAPYGGGYAPYGYAPYGGGYGTQYAPSIAQ